MPVAVADKLIPREQRLTTAPTGALAESKSRHVAIDVQANIS